jgi:DNA modification methylase
LKVPQNERINYWFLPEQKDKLSIILARLLEIENQNVQNFYLVTFAQILKSASIWLQKSVKPTRDLNKKIYNPIELFLTQSKKMIRKHYEFNKILKSEIRENIDKFRNIQCSDSRNLPCEDEKASLIVTSPPYVTSYEYADLHQLPSLWLGFMKELSEFRQKFIGSSYKTRENTDLKSELANKIVSNLKNKKQNEVKNYFADMLEAFEEIKRVLKKEGRACVVIGNTEFKGIEIENAEVFKQQFENIGFKTHKIIKREIPSKMLPSTRNPKTGKFGKVTDSNIKMAYPTEYILIMQKL